MDDTIEITLKDKPGVEVVKVFLEKISNDFKPILSSKVSLNSYAQKLNSNAIFIIAFSQKKIVGLTALYANDPLKKDSYLPIIGVLKEYRGHGIAKNMLDFSISFLKTSGFEKLSLETWQGSPAQNFYQKNNFHISKFVNDRENSGKSAKMFRWLGEICSDHDSFYKSKLEYHKELSDELNVNLFIKRDDLYPKFGGGNKARKLVFILNKARNNNCNAVVTAGGSQSNHCRATALYAASLGWKVILVIHDEKPSSFTGNLKLMKLSGAELRFVKHVEVKEAMDEAMADLIKEGFNPYYIWGGGHSVEGSLAYYEAVKELKIQLANTVPDYLFVASGTGATQAGLEVGIRKYYPNCKIIGVSVAREEKRGKNEILKSIHELNEYLGKPIRVPDEIEFNTNICGTGYESVFPELTRVIENILKKGLLIDPTYTGKAYYVLNTFVKNRVIKPNTNVIFWHTGGQLNLLSSDAL